MIAANEKSLKMKWQKMGPLHLLTADATKLEIDLKNSAATIAIDFVDHSLTTTNKSWIKSTSGCERDEPCYAIQFVVHSFKLP